jgi:twinkle protein
LLAIHAWPWSATWLQSRGISLEVAERNGLASQRAYSPVLSANTDALVFPYMRDGELVNIKYRGRGVIVTKLSTAV